MPPRNLKWVRSFLVLMLGTLLVLLTDLILEMSPQDTPDYLSTSAGLSSQDGELQLGFDPQPEGWDTPAVVQDSFIPQPFLKPY